ncbi:MAG: hypothetical protein JST54_26230 [Deltaproteobacteria bacterium]|nr:hypothetical protein [Deltaproteobacteria bacterium]
MAPPASRTFLPGLPTSGACSGSGASGERLMSSPACCSPSSGSGPVSVGRPSDSLVSSSSLALWALPFLALCCGSFSISSTVLGA